MEQVIILKSYDNLKSDPILILGYLQAPLKSTRYQPFAPIGKGNEWNVSQMYELKCHSYFMQKVETRQVQIAF